VSPELAEPVVYQSKLDWRQILLPACFVLLNMPQDFLLIEDQRPHRLVFAVLQLISVAMLLYLLVAQLKSQVILTETRLIYRSFRWWGWLGNTEIPLSKIEWLTLRDGRSLAGPGSVGVIWTSNDAGYRKQIGLPLAKAEYFRDLLQARVTAVQSGHAA